MLHNQVNSAGVTEGRKTDYYSFKWKEKARNLKAKVENLEEMILNLGEKNKGILKINKGLNIHFFCLDQGRKHFCYIFCSIYTYNT